MSLLQWMPLALAIGQVMAGPQISTPSFDAFASVKPVKSAPETYMGLIHSDQYNRDSCCSTHVGDREFWVCRDTSSVASGDLIDESTAGWSEFTTDGTQPLINNGLLNVTGINTNAFYMPAEDECASGHPAGYCADGGRWPIWPDSPPLPVTSSDGSVKLYTWIRQVHFPIASALGADNGAFPPISLYRADWNPSLLATALPSSTLAAENFFPANSVPFGEYGWVNGIDGFAYLYGRGLAGTYLARVPRAATESLSAYEYYTGNEIWSRTPPSPTDLLHPEAVIPNAGTGQQGTFYYSSYYNKYIWIGALVGLDPTVVYTTAPSPEGPWDVPSPLMTFPTAAGVDGGGDGWQYSFQAHPGLSERQGNGRDIWISETVGLKSGYANRLWRVEFQTL